MDLLRAVVIRATTAVLDLCFLAGAAWHWMRKG